MRRCAGLLLVAALAACAFGKRVGVDRQRDIDGAWAIRKGETRLDVTGDVATLFFQERTFVFEGIGALRGILEKKQVHLRGEHIRIDLDTERVAVARGRTPQRVTLPLARVPVGGRVRYADGAFQVR